jgi:outer membrane beta-barrel protein
MRERTIVQILLAVAVCVASSSASAQRHRHHRHHGGDQPASATAPAPDQVQGSGQPSDAGGTQAGQAAGSESGGSMTFTTEEASQPAPTQPEAGQPAQPEGGGLEGIGGADVRAARHTMREQIWAVQQIYALRNRRFELQPSVALSMNDPYVSHTGLGIAANFWVTNVLAVGANFIWNQGLNGRSDLDFHVARSGRLVVPINEYQLAAAGNFSYVPVYGKFLMFNQFIFHWDIYVMAGVGVMRTRPIPVVDPEVRSFQYDWRIMFNAGLGVRVFLNRWLAIFGELRNYVYSEILENTSIAQVDMPVGAGQRPQPGSRQDPSTWTGGSSITDNVMVQVGLSVFLPFSVTYRLLK